MAYVITQPCIGTKESSCVEVCPVDCIHSDEAAEQYFINPDEVHRLRGVCRRVRWRPSTPLTRCRSGRNSSSRATRSTSPTDHDMGVLDDRNSGTPRG